MIYTQDQGHNPDRWLAIWDVTGNRCVLLVDGMDAFTIYKPGPWEERLLA